MQSVGLNIYNSNEESRSYLNSLSMNRKKKFQADNMYFFIRI